VQKGYFCSFQSLWQLLLSNLNYSRAKSGRKCWTRHGAITYVHPSSQISCWSIADACLGTTVKWNVITRSSLDVKEHHFFTYLILIQASKKWIFPASERQGTKQSRWFLLNHLTILIVWDYHTKLFNLYRDLSVLYAEPLLWKSLWQYPTGSRTDKAGDCRWEEIKL
jgi:hypothetical protein